MTAPQNWNDVTVSAGTRPRYRHRLRDTAQTIALRHVQRRLARATTTEAAPSRSTAPSDRPARSVTSVPHFDRDRNQLVAHLRRALVEARIGYAEERRPWSQRPLWHVDAEPWTVWQALRRAARVEEANRSRSGDDHPTALQIQPRTRSVSRVPDRLPVGTGTRVQSLNWWLTRLLTREFVETHLADPRLGATVTLSDTCPAGDEWLVSRSARLDDPLSARLASEAGVVLSFRTRPRVTAVIDFPIDVVYTWVDANDPHWQGARAAHPPGENLVAAATAEARFVQSEELRYSLRSIEQFAPWVRRIWVVTSGQRPPWLRDHPQVTVVTHDDLWPDPRELPVFNSHAIEANLHRIPDLADHYLYLNDDMFLGRPVSPEHFFTHDGRPRVFPSREPVAPGPPESSDKAPDAAGKNNRDLVRLLTGTTVTCKYQHAPYAISRELVYELESRVPEIFRRTGMARYRSVTDVTVSGGLHHDYGLATGRAVVGALRYRYVDLDKDSRGRALRMIHDTRYADAFCLNAVEHAPPREEVVDLLDHYFPHAAAWEGLEIAEDWATRRDRVDEPVVRTAGQPKIGTDLRG